MKTGNNTSVSSTQKPSTNITPWMPKVIITPEAWKKSRYLCQKIDKDEWVGIPMYYATGSLEDKTMEITVIDIYPVHHAHSMSFQSTYDYDANYAFDKEYDLMQLKLGLIHSHVNAPVFFSQPDMDELKGNAKYHNYYLSIITNNANAWTAKIAVHVDQELTTTGVRTYYGSTGLKITEPISEKTTKEGAIIYDCSIVLEAAEVDAGYKALVDTLIASKPVIVTTAGRKTKDVSVKDMYPTINWKEVDDKFIALFLTGNNMPLDHAVKQIRYDASTMNPALFIDFVADHFNVGWLFKKEQHQAVAKMINHISKYNNLFSKTTIKIYEQFKEKIL